MSARFHLLQYLRLFNGIFLQIFKGNFGSQRLFKKDVRLKLLCIRYKNNNNMEILDYK